MNDHDLLELSQGFEASWFPSWRRTRMARKPLGRCMARHIFRGILNVVNLVGVPAVAAAASGAVRGESFDLEIAERIQLEIASFQIWLAENFVQASVASTVTQCVPFLLLGLAILVMAVLLMRIRNFIPCIVISEIARRQGRTTSVIDLLIATSLPISLAVAVSRYGQISVIAFIWFCLAYLFCRISFHPKRLRGFLDWMVRLRGPFGAFGVGSGDVGDADGDA